MKDITLHLIPFAGEQLCSEVHSNLMDLGYSVNRVKKSGICDASLQGLKGILVCLFGQVSSSKDAVLDVLSRFKQLPC